MILMIPYYSHYYRVGSPPGLDHISPQKMVLQDVVCENTPRLGWFYLFRVQGLRHQNLNLNHPICNS